MTFGPTSLTIIDTDAEQAHIERNACNGRCAQLSVELETLRATTIEGMRAAVLEALRGE